MISTPSEAEQTYWLAGAAKCLALMLWQNRKRQPVVFNLHKLFGILKVGSSVLEVKGKLALNACWSLRYEFFAGLKEVLELREDLVATSAFP